MAGILANSATASMVDGDTSADNAVSGYITGEQITLTVTDASPASVSWGQSLPAASSSSRSELDDDDVETVHFTPDVGGFYTITANVDGTTYVLRISVASVAQNTIEGSLGLQPLTDAQVPTPSSGVNLFCGSDHNSQLAIKSAAAIVSLLSGYGNGALFVGKHGSDSNGGKSPDAAFQSIGQAITAATALTPADDNRFAIVILDAGDYAESLSLPSYVHLFAPAAKLSGIGSTSIPMLTLSADSSIRVRELAPQAGQGGVATENSAGIKRIWAHKLTCSGSGGYGAANVGVSGGVLYYDVEETRVGANAVGIGDLSTASGHVHIEGAGDVYLEGANATGISRVGSGSIVGRVSHVLEYGSGVGSGTAFLANGGTIDMFVNEVSANTPKSESGGGVVNVLLPDGTTL